MIKKISKIIIPEIFYYDFFLNNFKEKSDIISYNHQYISLNGKISRHFKQTLNKYKLIFIIKIIYDFFIFYQVYKKNLKNGEIVIVEGLYPSLYLYLFNLIKKREIKFIYYNTDWLVDYNYKNIFQKILNNFFWKKLNFFLIEKSIFSISNSKSVINEYNKNYKNISKKNYYITAPFTINKNNQIQNKSIIKIIFLGVVKDHEIFNSFLNKINMYLQNSNKKIIVNFYGPINDEMLKLKCISKKNYSFAKFNGYLDQNLIKKTILKHDFGLHLHNTTSYSNYVVPSKVFFYLSNQVPIITNKNPEIERIMNKFSIGILIEDIDKNPKIEIDKIFKKKSFYKKNILKFNTFSKENFFKDFIKIINYL
jgi:hypothetical protein